MEMERMRLELPRWETLPDIGLYMDQVITLTDRVFSPMTSGGALTRSMVNNYVKVGLIARPQGKKYSREQLAQLVMVGLLKQALSLEGIARLMGILCESSVKDGYERFVEETEDVCEALATGQIMPTEETKYALAVRMGVAAAVCTIGAQRMLME